MAKIGHKQKDFEAKMSQMLVKNWKKIRRIGRKNEAFLERFSSLALQK